MTSFDDVADYFTQIYCAHCFGLSICFHLRYSLSKSVEYEARYKRKFKNIKRAITPAKNKNFLKNEKTVFSKCCDESSCEISDS